MDFYAADGVGVERVVADGEDAGEDCAWWGGGRGGWNDDTRGIDIHPDPAVVDAGFELLVPADGKAGDWDVGGGDA